MLASPLAARDHGIAIVHQELTVVPELTVAENIYLGRWSEVSGKRGFISPHILERKAAAQLAELGIEIDCSAKVGRIPIAHQQVVEIARAISYRPKVLILDEPTSSLPAAEVSLLLSLIRRLAGQGMSIIYVSHRMDEIPQIAQSVTVLRDGRLVATEPAGKVTTAEVVRLMIGGEVPTPVERNRAMGEQPVVLTVEGLSTQGKLTDISFDLRRGQILGLAGLLGSGRTELLRAIYGLDPLSAGRVAILGNSIRKGAPRAMLAAGVGFAPEDRKKEGLALNMSVSNNLVMACQERVTRAGFLLPVKEEEIARTSVDHMSIKARSLGQSGPHAVRRQPTEGRPRQMPQRRGQGVPPR